MDFKLTKSQKEIKKAAWEFARGEFDKELIIELSREQEFPENILKKAGDLGFIGIHFPEEYDGGGMGLFENLLVGETFCTKDSTLGAALMFTGYGAECLFLFGDNPLKEKFLPPVIEGRIISTGAFTEPGQGHDIRKVNTTAIRDNDTWLINGKKSFVPFGGLAGYYVVLCETDPDADPKTNSMSMILVEAGCKGISTADVGEKLGGRMIPFADVIFEDVRVPASYLIGKQGKGYMQAQKLFDHNRIQMAGLALGTAQGAFDRALDYVRQREQFGKKLAQFQVTRHKIADMASKIETARFTAYHAAWQFDNGKPSPRQAAVAKMTAARVAMEVSDEAVQLFGGYGYMTEYEVEHFYRDAKQAEIFQGTPAVLKDIISDEIIGRLK